MALLKIYLLALAFVAGFFASCNQTSITAENRLAKKSASKNVPTSTGNVPTSTGTEATVPTGLICTTTSGESHFGPGDSVDITCSSTQPSGTYRYEISSNTCGQGAFVIDSATGKTTVSSLPANFSSCSLVIEQWDGVTRCESDSCRSKVELGYLGMVKDLQSTKTGADVDTSDLVIVGDKYFLIKNDPKYRGLTQNGLFFSTSRLGPWTRVPYVIKGQYNWAFNFTNADRTALAKIGSKLMMTIKIMGEADRYVVTDGTTAGTVLLPGPTGQVAGCSSTLCIYQASFVSPDGRTMGEDVWRTDGTVEGTRWAKEAEIVPGPSSASRPGWSQGTFMNDVFYFFLDDTINGTELWRTDGTRDGTFMVKDINPAAGSGIIPIVDYNGFASNFAVVNFGLGNRLVFCASDGITGKELYISDGTATGTQMIKDLNVGSGDGCDSVPLARSGKVYFKGKSSVDAKGWELYRSAGTGESTVLVTDINVGAGDSNPIMFVANSNGIIITATDGAAQSTGGTEFYFSNGAISGETPVPDTHSLGNNYTGSRTSPFFAWARVINNKFVFSQSVSDAVATYKYLQAVFVADANGQNKTQIMSLGASFSYGYLAASPTDVFFRCTDTLNGSVGTHGENICKSDGSTEPAAVGVDLRRSDNGSSHPQELWTDGARIYFSALQGSLYQPWISDGTATGTYKLADIAVSGGYQSSKNQRFWLKEGGRVYFSAVDQTDPASGSSQFGDSLEFNSSDIWSTNGTSAGTIKEVNQTPASLRVGAVPYGFAGTGAQRRLIHLNVTAGDINSWSGSFNEATGSSGEFSSSVLSYGWDRMGGSAWLQGWRYLNDDRLVAVGTTAATGNELIIFGDAGTTPSLIELKPGTGSATPFKFLTFGDRLLFSTGGGPSGFWELAGASPVAKFILNSGSGNSHPVVCGTTAYFLAFVGSFPTRFDLYSYSAGQPITYLKPLGTITTINGAFCSPAGELILAFNSSELGNAMAVVRNSKMELLMDFAPGTTSQGDFQWVATNSKGAYFREWSQACGCYAIWRTDGTVAGTKVVTNRASQRWSSPIGLGPLSQFSIPSGVVLDDRIYLTLYHPQYGYELFKLD